MAITLWRLVHLIVCIWRQRKFCFLCYYSGDIHWQVGNQMRDISEIEFDDVLANAPNLVLVDFWADWCGPCKVVKPVLEAMSAEYEGQVDFVAVNADHNRQLMKAFGIRSLPTVLLLKPHEDRAGAKVLEHTIGAQPASRYAAMIEKGLNPKPGLLTRLFGGS